MKSIVVAAGLVAASMGATSAQAAVQICVGNCLQGLSNVAVNQNNTAAQTQTGSIGNASILFTSSENLLAPSNGQARISASDGTLNSLTFELLDGYTFSSAVFNLNDASRDSTQVTITYSGINFGPVTTQLYDLRNSGQNFMGIYGTAGEAFSKISFTFANGGVDDLRQLRLGGVTAPAVPEPATWAMMIAGFGLIGSAMRRRKTALAFG